MRISNKIAGNKKISFVQLIWIPAAIPLLVVLCSFILGGWSWGLMDDYGLMMITGNVWERSLSLFKNLFAWGVFRPAHSLHVGIFYGVFAHHPDWFYVFRWFEVVAALAVWGWLAVLVTRRNLALPLVIGISLCFFKFYDGFFFLSTQEITGLFLAGCTGGCFFKAFAPVILRQARVAWRPAIWGGIWLLLAFGTKETYLSVGLIWGLVLLGAGLTRPHARSLWIPGLILVVTSLAYGVFLKLMVVADYSSRYSFSNIGQIGANIFLWVRHDLLAHAPWIIIAALLMILKRPASPADLFRRWGIWLALGFYASYTLILLPWDTTGSYSTPLGVLFAFLITVLIAERLETVRVDAFVAVVLAALVLNMLVGGAALKAASSYQQDTASLLKWLATNTQFEYEVVQNGAVVRANAAEPGGAIPALVGLYYGKTYGEFIFTPRVKEIVEDVRTRYYLYGTTWGDQDLSRLGKMYYPVFVSKNWIMFRRLY